jgi:hypothetical protein
MEMPGPRMYGSAGMAFDVQRGDAVGVEEHRGGEADDAAADNKDGDFGGFHVVQLQRRLEDRRFCSVASFMKRAPDCMFRTQQRAHSRCHRSNG